MSSIRAQLLAAVTESGLSDRQLSVSATGSTDTIRNLRRGAAPRADTLEALCRVLGLTLRIAPGEDESPTTAQEAARQADDERALAPRPLTRFSDTWTLPVRQWADDSPDGQAMPEEPKRAAAPEDLADPQAFYVLMRGKSMLRSGICPSDYCLVSPCERLEVGRPVWFRSRDGAQTIKWLLRITAEAYDLGAWKPHDDLGHDKPFMESWSSADVAERGVVLAVYSRRPSADKPAVWRDCRRGPLDELWWSAQLSSNGDLMSVVDQLYGTVWAVGDTEGRLKLSVGKGLFSDSERELLLKALEGLEGSVRGIRPAVEAAAKAAGHSAPVTPGDRD